MKHPAFRLSLLAVVAGALSTGALCAQDVSKEPKEPVPAVDSSLVMIENLRVTPPGIFQYGTWNGRVAIVKDGLAVVGGKGATGKGGFGRDREGPVDLSQARYIEVALGVVASNEVPQVTIALNDADGTQFNARIAVSQLVPGSPVWLRARRADFHLNDIERGSDGEMDWAHVTRWHVQGDWNTDGPCSLIFIALRARK